ncbi:helix-turn-helix domain-containing protein, partial [Mobiluncus mulieris]|uniref:helix-turn-helix domain-containing protein n=1 Tax=Mobiluncus mulieris TaxID=2052 RepID=UPI002433187E
MSENEERALFLLARGQVKRDREMIRQLVKIRKSRESEGLTQKEVAARMGSDQGFVSRFESLETNPNRACQVFCVSGVWFVILLG